jgi:hypothetical protein
VSWQFVDVQHRLYETLELRARQNPACELGEFRRDVAGVGKMALATARPRAGLDPRRAAEPVRSARRLPLRPALPVATARRAEETPPLIEGARSSKPWTVKWTLTALPPLSLPRATPASGASAALAISGNYSEPALRAVARRLKSR